MNVKIQLGAVWHFSLAVRDPAKSAQFWTKNFDLQEMFRSDEAIALTNDAIIIGFFKGTPHPDTIDHMSFYLDSMRALHEALEMLKKNGVELEDPGDEIGPDRCIEVETPLPKLRVAGSRPVSRLANFTTDCKCRRHGGGLRVDNALNDRSRDWH
jgi:catechol 2,3-dioxygenase-like lactoylglutathione lyase family enzyme